MRRTEVRMWVPVGGDTVQLASSDPTNSGRVELTVGEARRLAVVLALLSGDWSPMADLRRSLTIALAREEDRGEPST